MRAETSSHIVWWALAGRPVVRSGFGRWRPDGSSAVIGARSIRWAATRPMARGRLTTRPTPSEWVSVALRSGPYQRRRRRRVRIVGRPLHQLGMDPGGVTAPQRQQPPHLRGDREMRRLHPGETMVLPGSGQPSPHRSWSCRKTTPTSSPSSPRALRPKPPAGRLTPADFSAGAAPSSAFSTHPSSAARWAACSPRTQGWCCRVCLPPDSRRRAKVRCAGLVSVAIRQAGPSIPPSMRNARTSPAARTTSARNWLLQMPPYGRHAESEEAAYSLGVCGSSPNAPPDNPDDLATR